MVCPPVQENNPRALANGFSPVQEDKPLYNYFITLISVDLAQFELFQAKVCDFL